MTTDVTPRWALPQLFSGQAQKEVFHNEALARIDMLLHGQVESADENVPPVTPDDGDCWIVAAAATGAWAGREKAIACWTEGGWRFVAPRTGLSIWVVDRANSMHYLDGVWQDRGVGEDGLYVEGVRVVGTQVAAITDATGGATVDGEARSCINAMLAAMRHHGLIAP